MYFCAVVSEARLSNDAPLPTRRMPTTHPRQRRREEKQARPTSDDYEDDNALNALGVQVMPHADHPAGCMPRKTQGGLTEKH